MRSDLRVQVRDRESREARHPRFHYSRAPPREARACLLEAHVEEVLPSLRGRNASPR